MSPLSDTTNVAPAVAEADLFDHIKAMVTTGGPAIVLAGIGFAVLGHTSAAEVSSETVDQILTSLDEMFNLNFITLIPIILVLVLAYLKMPAFPTLLISGLSGAVIAVLVQGVSPSPRSCPLWKTALSAPPACTISTSSSPAAACSP